MQLFKFSFAILAVFAGISLLRAWAEDPYFKDKYKSKNAYRPGGKHFGYPVEQNVPPWPSRYKIKPSDKEKLTAADVVGPDGIVYPNWQHVGVDGGIPDVEVKFRLAAKEKTDISAALAQAIAQVGTRGGGAILIGPGTYYLDRPLIIKHSKVVIRGSGLEQTLLIFRYDGKVPKGWPPASVFTFQGGALEGEERPLAEDGKRGDTSLKMKDVGDLAVGDHFVLRAPCTERWLKTLRTPHKGAWGTRTNQYRIRAIDGNTISIGEPLRIDFPVVDGSTIRRVQPIQYCGLESMSIQHQHNELKFDTLTSQWAWNCWARDLKVIDCGCSGVHFRGAKKCEVRDCEFIGFDPKIHKPHQNWWAYGGFTQSSDCLMDNCVFRRFRHAPQVQFGAQGNVIRNSVFEGSDAQWHAGWSTENLYENCVVTHGNHGSYGHGCYVTGSNDSTHGPEGPRNVIYNCDFRSPKDGFFNRGVNENWLVLYNRFVVRDGAGYRAEGGSFDAIIKGNVFVLQSDKWPMVMLTTRDCTGTELIDNTLYGGNGKLLVTEAPLAVNKGNRSRPLKDKVALRPQPRIKSIFEALTEDAK